MNDGPQKTADLIGAIADTIETRDVDWLEPGYLARGKIVDLVGDPGVGKSFLMADLASRLSRGWALFDNDHREPCSVVLFNLEDDAADTIVPRLVESGADLSRVRCIPAAVDVAGALHIVTLPDDLALLESVIVADKAAVLAIDPITACLSEKFDTHKDASIRKILAELAAMAARTNIAVIMVRHLNKQSGNGKALYRGGGSIAFPAAARTAFLVDFDPTDPAPEAERRRVIACIKSNIGPKPRSRAFRLQADMDRPIARVQWIDAPCDLTADDLLRPRHQRNTDALDEAVGFLADQLAGGPKLSAEIADRAALLKIAPATLARARGRLGVKAIKQEFSGAWLSALPDGEVNIDE